MYDEELSPAPVKPLNVKRKEETLSVRRKRDEMKEINVGRDVDIDEGGLKSPIWVPRLTPTRKGDDLFISVGWGAKGRP
jgi:stress response protein YsnF